jgi:hypothetical protein
MDFSVEVEWLSPKSGKIEVAYGKNLSKEQASSLVDRIRLHGDWSELKKYIDMHEGDSVHYLLREVVREEGLTRLKLVLN